MNLEAILKQAHEWRVEVCVHHRTIQFIDRMGSSTMMLHSVKTDTWYGSAWDPEYDVVHYVSGGKAPVAIWCLCALVYGPKPPQSDDLRYSTRKPGI